MTAVFVEAPASSPRASRSWRSEAKLEQARTTFEPEVEWLRQRASAIGSTLDSPSALAALDVYRTYSIPTRARWTASTGRQWPRAASRRGLPIVLLLEDAVTTLHIRFQQTTPAVFAKGVEDTALYRYNRLLCLNEVGGDPGRFSLTIDDFHAANLERRGGSHITSSPCRPTTRSEAATSGLGSSRCPG